MHSEVFTVNESSKRHGIEKLHENLVSFFVVASNDFFSEGEALSHVSTLVIASEHNACFLEIELDAAKQEDDLHAVNASVYVISEEEVTDHKISSYLMSAGSPAFSSMCTKS